MSVLASPPRPEQPALAPVRHGSTRLILGINGDVYKLRRQTAPRGAVAWALVKATGERAGSAYSVIRAKGEVACTCYDSSHTGAECKHVRALVAVGLLARRSVTSPLPAARSRKGGQS